METLEIVGIETDKSGAIHVICADGCGTRFPGGWDQLKSWAESNEIKPDARDEILRDAIRGYLAKGATKKADIESLAGSRVVRDYSVGKIATIEKAK